jgi:hypothetical protein
MHQKGENHCEMSIKTRVLHDKFWHLSVYTPKVKRPRLSSSPSSQCQRSPDSASTIPLLHVAFFSVVVKSECLGKRC